MSIFRERGAELVIADAGLTQREAHTIYRLLISSALYCRRTDPGRSRRTADLADRFYQKFDLSKLFDPKDLHLSRRKLLGLK